jgi:hypothetical protein
VEGWLEQTLDSTAAAIAGALNLLGLRDAVLAKGIQRMVLNLEETPSQSRF